MAFSKLAESLGQGSEAVLTCYLDDSDNDQGPVMALSGFIASSVQWERFEPQADEFMQSYGVDLLHTKDFHHTKGVFKGWPRYKKRQFILDLFAIAKANGMGAVAASYNKADAAAAKGQQGMQDMSPMGVCFAKLITGILMKLRPPQTSLPLSFFVEAGHRNNGNILKYFNWLIEQNSVVSGKLGTLSFIEKSNCRAIQLADFLAFYSRKVAEKWDADGYPGGFPSIEYFDLMHAQIPLHFERSFEGEPKAGYAYPEKKGGATKLPGYFIMPTKGGL